MTPEVYRNEDSNGEPVLVTSGYTVDLANGKVTFAAAQAQTDEIRASYKMGVIDFNILGSDRGHDVDVAENPAKYLGILDLETHFYIKTTANRWL